MAQKRGRSSWETPSWEAHVPPIDACADSDAEVAAPDYSEIVGEEAGTMLFNLLLDMKFRGTPMSATHACLIAYWASQAGAVGPVTKLGCSPSTQSGNVSRHFDLAAKTRERQSRYYWLDLPVSGRSMPHGQ